MPVYPRDLESGQRLVGNVKPYEWVWIEQSVVKYDNDGNWYLDPKARFHASNSDSALDAKWRFQISKRHPEKLWILPDTSKPLGYYCLIPPLANNNPIWHSQLKELGWLPVNLIQRPPILDRFNNMSWLNVMFVAVGILITIDGVLGNPFKDQFNFLVNLVAGGAPILARAVVPVVTKLVHAQIVDAEQTAQDDTGKVIDDDNTTVDQLQAPAPRVGGPTKRTPPPPSQGGRVIPLWDPSRRTHDVEDDDLQLG